MTRSVLVLLVALSGCAGSARQAAPPRSATRAAAPKPPPPVPADPIELVPADASFVASIDLAALARSPQLATARDYATRYGCVAAAQLDWLTGTTDRIVLIGSGPPTASEWLVILLGRYAEGDAARALDTFAPAPARASRRHGRFTLLGDGSRAGSVLEGRLLLLGSEGFVLRVLQAIDAGAQPAFRERPLLRELGGRVRCLQSTACALVEGRGRAAQVLQRELGAAGAKPIGKAVASADTAVALSLGEDLVLTVVSDLGTPGAAAAIAKQVNDLLWQLDVFAGLAGFPDVIDDARVSAQGEHVELRWEVKRADLERLLPRVSRMLEVSGAPACEVTP